MSCFKDNKWEGFYRKYRQRMTKHQREVIDRQLIKPFLAGITKDKRYKRN